MTIYLKTMTRMATRMALLLLILLTALMPVYGQEATDEPAPEAPTQDEDILRATNQVLDYIAQQPQNVAIYCTFTGAPELDLPASEYISNEDELFPLASAYKTVILAEMARQLDAGLIDLSTEVALDDVNAYWLVGTDGGAHQAWLDSLGDDAETVTLEEIAYGMIRFSSNAAPDYLLDVVLGYAGFADLFDLLGVENITLPDGTYLSLFLAQQNHETGTADMDALDAESLDAERARLQALFLEDPDWRQAELDTIVERLTTSGQDMLTDFTIFEEQATFFIAYSPKGSAADISTVMAAAYTGDAFTEEAQAFMQRQLNWLYDVNPANEDVYTALGAKGGSLAGINAGVWYVEIQGGPMVQLAVLYQNLPLDLWFSWAITGSQQVLELRTFAYGEGCSPFLGLAEDGE